jgi:hypothetical protein
VTGLVTRGRGDANKNQWVIHYRLSYSNDSKVWYFYQDSSHLDGKVCLSENAGVKSMFAEQLEMSTHFCLPLHTSHAATCIYEFLSVKQQEVAPSHQFKLNSKHVVNLKFK